MTSRRHAFAGLVLMCVLVPGVRAYAQSVSDPVDVALDALPNVALTSPLTFVGITPCRLADTRGGPSFPPGPFGPPSLVGQPPGGAFRSFAVAGNCSIPSSARAVSANMAVTNTSGTGFISVWPGGDPQPDPLVASLNFSAGQTIANAVLAPLGNGGINVFARVTTDLIIDVNGYFDTGAPKVVVRFVDTVTPNNANGSGIANCNAGERATGGGVSMINGNANVIYFQPGGAPFPGFAGEPATGWTSSWYNVSGVTDTFRIFVMCAAP